MNSVVSFFEFDFGFGCSFGHKLDNGRSILKFTQLKMVPLFRDWATGMNVNWSIFSSPNVGG